eukprot:TRINITY_DN8790_c0_g1_i1.p1 TRINITY_DN8790_c0_g1~~TRINITY_DN8790_c0_g1_i1.p1  ORF type:complete len:1139 (+),score=262.92 TRINITY_DN8790_c0_g1_i1:215-3418(+)
MSDLDSYSLFTGADAQTSDQRYRVFDEDNPAISNYQQFSGAEPTADSPIQPLPRPAGGDEPDDPASLVNGLFKQVDQETVLLVMQNRQGPEFIDVMRSAMNDPTLLAQARERHHIVLAAKLLRDGVRLLTTYDDQDADDQSWNSRFQRMMQKPLRNLAEQNAQARGMVSIVDAFMTVANRVVTTIVDERSLPATQKSIQTIAAGGVAGGDKFLVDGVFFKYALDSAGLYGGDEYAMKAASHEFRSLMQIVGCGLPLSFPLMSLVDYRGFRVTAIAQLPIDKSTLVYGSADGGKTIHADLASVNAVLAQMGKQLNLKMHNVPDEHGRPVAMAGPGDLEVHLGRDRRVYVLDTARVMPPEQPHKSTDVFWKLFRREFVQKHSVPLCSDAYTGWGRLDIRAHNAEIKEATSVYINQLCAQYAAVSDGAIAINKDVELVKFSMALHHAGISARHFGIVRAGLKTAAAQAMALNDLVARVLKQRVRAYLRDTAHLPAQEVLCSVATRLLDEFCSADRVQYNAQLKQRLSDKFTSALFPHETAESFDLLTQSGLNFQMILNCVLNTTGIRVSAQALQKIGQVKIWPGNAAEFPIAGSDVEALVSVPQYPSFIFGAKAKSIYADALVCTEKAKADALFDQANDLFRTATAVNASDSAIWGQWAAMCLHRAERCDGAERYKFLQQAAVKYSMSNEVGVKESNFSCADLQCYLTIGRIGALLEQTPPQEVARWKPEQQYCELMPAVDALNAAKHIATCLHMIELPDTKTRYGMFPRYLEAYATACQLYGRCKAVDPQTRAQKLDMAIKLLETVIARYQDASKRAEILSEWGATLFDIGKLMEEMRQIPQANMVFGMALQKFAEVSSANPANAAAMKFRGNCLFRLAMLSQNPKQSVSYLQQAVAEYERFLIAEPSDTETMWFIGSALAVVNQRCGNMQHAVLAQAEPHLSRLWALQKLPIHTQPDALPIFMATLEQLAMTSIQQANQQREPRLRMAHLQKARDCLERLSVLQPGVQDYNMACVYAQLGDFEQCRMSLQRSVASGRLPPIQAILGDTDIAPAKSQPWFMPVVQGHLR